MKNAVWYIIVGCLLGYILFFRLGFGEVKQPVIVRSDTVTLVDTINVPVYEKWEKPIPKAIIGAGSDEKKIYSRNIINDSLGTLVITDTLQHNELLGYSVAGEINSIKEVQKISTTLTSPLRNKLLVGVNFAYTPAFISVYPAATLVTKKGLGVSIGYDFINKIYYGGISKVIQFRK